MQVIRTKKSTYDCAEEYIPIDFSQPSAIDMEAQVNVSHQIRTLLPHLVNKRTNSNTCNKPSTSFHRKYVVHQIIFSTYCIVLKMTYDMKDHTYFPTCKVNIMQFFLLSSRRELG